MIPNKKKKIIIDIDGVLTIWGEVKLPYAKKVPNKISIQFVNLLVKEGYYVELFTARYKKDRAITEKWLKENGVLYSKLTLGKAQYDYWIDDRITL